VHLLSKQSVDLSIADGREDSLVEAMRLNNNLYRLFGATLEQLKDGSKLVRATEATTWIEVAALRLLRRQTLYPTELRRYVDSKRFPVSTTVLKLPFCRRFVKLFERRWFLRSNIFLF
jgi:hypothetical protein